MKAKTICEIHKTLLVRTKVPVIYGMPDFDESFLAADKLFPHSNKYVIGGCTVDESFPRHSEKMVCKECRKAETVWKKMRRKNASA